MSYETENYLPAGVTKRSAIEFAEHLGYRRNGTYRHLGDPQAASLVYFEDKDYKSWQTVELKVSIDQGCVIVATRTRVGRSFYDFEMQNRTVKEFKRRFGGRIFKDGRGGAFYDPGPAMPPSASGCKLAVDRLDWNLTRINHYLIQFQTPTQHESQVAAEKIWPVMRQMNYEVFAANVLLPYATSMMEDYFKSIYIALLRFSPNKASALKDARLKTDHLLKISEGLLTIEEAFVENLPFQLPSKVGRHFHALDNRLDILSPLRRPSKRAKQSRLERLDALVQKRHELIHGMQMDIKLDKKAAQRLILDMTRSLTLVHKYICAYHKWECILPVSSNFLGKTRLKAPPNTSQGRCNKFFLEERRRSRR